MIGQLSFEPLVPWWLIATLGGLALVLLTIACAKRARGTLFRALFFLTGLAVLAGPSLESENRQALSDIALLVVDRSGSQHLDGRMAETDKAEAALKAELAKTPNLDLRTVIVGDSGDGTPLVTTAEQALADIPRDRLAGVIALTDGRADDVPTAQGLRNEAITAAPFHLLATGRPGEQDRRITIIEAPSYAVVSQEAAIKLRVDDGKPGETPGNGATADITLSVDGKPGAGRRVPIGVPVTMELTPDHRGPNLYQFSVAPGPHELTLANNTQVVTINGIRDRLRVLLISGEPNMGERVWRNILKSDPSVDLVHFTILRQPQKQDRTPINELSLIAFPSRKLFEKKLSQFDLVIFDRYRQRGVLPARYLANIARYVKKGGALMVAASPHADAPLPLYETPLARILPVVPRGPDLISPILPKVTPIGARHPVTADLPGAGAPGQAPNWGHWLRMSNDQTRSGTTVMAGPGGAPLLVLDRVGKGRVGILLSDEAWLWQRDYDGGGPLAALLRRLGHWLMKEPDLEEENLSATAKGKTISIKRHSLHPNPPPVILTAPDGSKHQAALNDHPDGVATTTVTVGQTGLWRLDDGGRRTAVMVGNGGGLELRDVRASLDVLAPVVKASDGSARFLSQSGLPSIRKVVPDTRTAGKDWIGLRRNQAYAVLSTRRTPLLPVLPALIVLGVLLLAAWTREGR